MTVLKDGAFADGELASAVVALPQAVAENAFGVHLARLCANAFQTVQAVHSAAMRTGRAFRPHDRFQRLKRLGFIVEKGLIELAGHVRIP